MNGYRVSVRESARKSLLRLPGNLQRRIEAKIDALGHNPRPSGCVKLSGQFNLHRLRTGDYRIVYAVDDAARLVDVRIIAHRSDVYRGL